MKKNGISIVTLLVVVLALVFASCTKDGVYKPKKKISKIYETFVTDQASIKELKESWTWDGKLLSKIEYGKDNVINFTYEKKQLKTVTNGHERIELNYDDKGKYIDNFKMYYENELEATYTFEHGDKHLITGYTIEFGSGMEPNKSARLVQNVFRFLIPEIADNEAAEYAKNANNGFKDGSKTTVTLTYDKKNVVEKVTTDGIFTTNYTYTYTDYLNPFYGLLDIDMSTGLSKNAVATMVIKESGSYDNTYSYTYKAEGKVPTQVTTIFSYNDGISPHTTTTITDYEFTK